MSIFMKENPIPIKCTITKLQWTQPLVEDSPDDVLILRSYLFLYF